MTPENSPPLEIAERIAVALERIADAVDTLSMLGLVVDIARDDEGEETHVLNIWKEGESE